MSKWCGDENCLQCADKEPDPYVHLPHEEYQALRDERDRLIKTMQQAYAYINDHRHGKAKAVLFDGLQLYKKAALTPAAPPLTPNEATE